MSAFPDIPVVAEEIFLYALPVVSVTGICSEINSGDFIPEKNTSDEILRLIDRGTHEPEKAMEKFWTLDPIDGTRGFLAGRQYAIALALIADGEVVLGVLGCPELAFGRNPLAECGEQGIACSPRKKGLRSVPGLDFTITARRHGFQCQALPAMRPGLRSCASRPRLRPQSYELSGRVANGSSV